MDKPTIETYNNEAESIALLHATLVPERIYALVDQYFIKGGKTLDVGCGIGRDTHWLTTQGFLTRGIDASSGMLNYAKSLYPEINFILDTLPALKTQGNETFANILCSAVLMHLDDSDFMAACTRLFSLLMIEGVLIISFRGTNEQGYREKGKLYNPIEVSLFMKFFTDRQGTVLVNESIADHNRGLVWHNFVIKK